jgi:hypothetical protein
MKGLSVGGRALAAVVVVMAILPATAGSAAGTVAPAVAMLSASPNSNLADGQAITVTASGYPTNASLDLVQCVQDQGCDFSNLMVLGSGDIGGYTTTFFVHRLLTLDAGMVVDCAVAQNCILVSLDISDLSTGAQTSIAFDPNAPPPKPLHFRVAIDPTGHVRVDKGVARITGTVHCNQGVEIYVQLQLTQVWQRSIFQSFGFVDLVCTGDQTFSAVFRPQNGLFGAGAAKVSLDAYGSTSTSYEIFKHVTVNLVPSTN